MPGAPLPSDPCSAGDFDCSKCEVLCDNSTAPPTAFLRRYVTDCGTGDVVSVIDTELDGTTPYVVVGDVVSCAGDITIPAVNVPDGEIVCFDSGPSPLVRLTVYDPNTGAIVAGPFFRDIITGADVVPTGNPIACPEVDSADVEQEILCDDDTDPATPFIRRYTFLDGVLSAVADFELDGTTPYVVAGAAVTCDPESATGSCTTLCDEGNGDIQFVRCYSVSPSGTVTTTDVDIDGAPYVVVGPVNDCCSDEPCVDSETQVLCDNGTTPFTPFLRRYDIDSFGIVTIIDTNLDGTPYVLSGSAVVCPPAASGLLLSNGTVNIFGVGSWALGVDDGGGLVKSVTFSALRAGSTGPPPAAGSITTTDAFGNTETLFAGQVKTWEVDSGEDSLTGTLRVDLTDPADIVTVLWTEV